MKGEFRVWSPLHFEDLVGAYRSGWAGWDGQHCTTLAAMREYAQANDLEMPDIPCPDCTPQRHVVAG